MQLGHGSGVHGRRVSLAGPLGPRLAATSCIAQDRPGAARSPRATALPHRPAPGTPSGRGRATPGSRRCRSRRRGGRGPSPPVRPCRRARATGTARRRRWLAGRARRRPRPGLPAVEASRGRPRPSLPAISLGRWLPPPGADDVDVHVEAAGRRPGASEVPCSARSVRRTARASCPGRSVHPGTVGHDQRSDPHVLDAVPPDVARDEARVGDDAVGGSHDPDVLCRAAVAARHRPEVPRVGATVQKDVRPASRPVRAVALVAGLEVVVAGRAGGELVDVPENRAGTLQPLGPARGPRGGGDADHRAGKTAGERLDLMKHAAGTLRASSPGSSCDALRGQFRVDAARHELDRVPATLSASAARSTCTPTPPVRVRCCVARTIAVIAGPAAAPRRRSVRSRAGGPGDRHGLEELPPLSRGHASISSTISGSASPDSESVRSVQRSRSTERWKSLHFGWYSSITLGTCTAAARMTAWSFWPTNALHPRNAVEQVGQRQEPLDDLDLRAPSEASLQRRGRLDVGGPERDEPEPPALSRQARERVGDRVEQRVRAGAPHVHRHAQVDAEHPAVGGGTLVFVAEEQRGVADDVRLHTDLREQLARSRAAHVDGHEAGEHGRPSGRAPRASPPPRRRGTPGPPRRCPA